MARPGGRAGEIRDTAVMPPGARTALRRGRDSGALVEGDRPPDVLAVRWSRAGFVALGLLSTLWLLRRLPIGFFYMFGFWTAVGCAVLLVFAFLMKWREPWLGRTIPFLAAGIPVGLLLLAMIPLSRADARGESLPLTDTQVRALAIALQAALAIWVARRTRQAGERIIELVVVYAVALATMTIRLTVAQNLSAWWFIPVVAVLAVRIATLPEQVSTRPQEIVTGAGSDPGDARLVQVACAFVGIAGAFALQAQIMSRPSGLAAFVVAFVAGLALLIHRRRPSPLAGALAVTAALGVFAPILFVVVLLMPSLAGAEYLLDIGFRHDPKGLSFGGSRPISGGYQRWYATGMDERAALASIADAFRSPPVSAWPDADGHGVRGLLFGYRIESRYNPVPSPCRPDVQCVVVTVRRSTD
jgi:hypothetical protein